MENVRQMQITKMKALKPSHRNSKRYLLIFGKDANFKIIEQIIFEFIGILGHAKANPQIINSDNLKKEEIIISVNTKELDVIRSCFLFSGKDITIKRVSGTIKGLSKKK